ncbi:hypothetical protein CRG98_050223, partial [Punica granatum]
MGSSKRGKKARSRGSDSESEDEFESADEKLMVESGDASDDFEDSDVNDDDDNDDGDEDRVDKGEEEDDDDDEDGSGGADGEMEKLEKEYMELRNQEQDILKNLKRHKDGDLQKGEAVKNQKYEVVCRYPLLFFVQTLWNKALELRFLLQKSFSSSNRLPQELVRSSFCNSNEAVNKAYLDVIDTTKETLDSILELQE